MSKHYVVRSTICEVTVDQEGEAEYDYLDEDEIIGPKVYHTYEEALMRHLWVTGRRNGQSDEDTRRQLELARDYLEGILQDAIQKGSLDADTQLGLEHVLHIIEP